MPAVCTASIEFDADAVAIGLTEAANDSGARASFSGIRVAVLTGVPAFAGTAERSANEAKRQREPAPTDGVRRFSHERVILAAATAWVNDVCHCSFRNPVSHAERNEQEVRRFSGRAYAVPESTE
jgi:hypothetical protein